MLDRERYPGKRIMKKIVVTGAAGRLGRKVVSDLVSRGYSVLAVDKDRKNAVPLSAGRFDGRSGRR